MIIFRAFNELKGNNKIIDKQHFANGRENTLQNNNTN